ncbi:MAG TPA: lipoprotein insertase outer membrane protein LolB [Burkholderiaceae bacterium]|nr:lipoprotein insertase outer membrane protein LolB [Burkholderiaceae bacterium]
MTTVSRFAATRRRFQRSAAALIALLLAGCASLAPPPAGGPAPAPSYRNTIDLGGRLSVRYRQNGRDEAIHGSFTWTQAPQRTELILLSPLGQTLARIEVTPAAATLTQANQPQRTAADVDALASQSLGWPLPVAGLRDWLQGFVTTVDGQRQAVPRTPGAMVQSDGWRIQYTDWADDGDYAAVRPKRIDLERNGAPGGNGADPVAIRIVIDNWH